MRLMYFEFYTSYFTVSCTSPCAGKSTLACSLSRELHSRGNLTYILDGDNLRHGLNKNLGFSADDRAENIPKIELKMVNEICPTPSEMAGEVASYLEEKGFLHYD